MEINSAIGLLGDRAADHVADRQRVVPFALAFAEGRERIGRLAALGDGKDQRLDRRRR